MNQDVISSFLSGNFDTHFVKKYFDSSLMKQGDPEEAEIAAIFASQLYNTNLGKLKAPEHQDSNWKKNR